MNKRLLHMVRNLSITALAAVLIGMQGCSAGSDLKVKQAPSSDLGKFKIVAVDVSADAANFDSKERDELAGQILGGLRQSGKFARVYATSASMEHDADLKVSVVVHKIHKVGSDARAWAGALAGTATVDASVALIEISDSQMLATAEVHAHSGSGSIFSGPSTTASAIEKLSDQIVKFVVKH